MYNKVKYHTALNVKPTVSQDSCFLKIRIRNHALKGFPHKIRDCYTQIISVDR